MVNQISIVISKNPDGYLVKFPELEPIDYQDSSLEGVLNRLKDALETHLISSEISQGETTVESILKIVDKLTSDFTEEELSQITSEGKEIMKFAGIWEDLPEEDFRNFCEEVEQRRQNVYSCNLYLQEYRQLSFSLITYYEILSGLKHRDAQKQLDKFLGFSQLNQILLLTEESVTISAKIYADLRKKGTPLDDIDLLIALTPALSAQSLMILCSIDRSNRLPVREINTASVFSLGSNLRSFFHL